MSLPNWSAILDSPGPGKAPYPSLTNAVRVLDHDPHWSADHLWFDEFTNRIMCAHSTPREWGDTDDIAMTLYMQDTTGLMRITKPIVRDAVEYVSRQRLRHVVRDWLHTLVWDRVNRIDHAFEDGWGAVCDMAHPSDYVRAASKNFFLGLVARVIRPGCKLDTMPVFEGPQGTRKSSALDLLGDPWYATIDEAVGTKDFLQALRGKWVVEIAELNAFTRTESAHVKSMLSRRVDTYRPTYGIRALDIPRQCAFAGTTNREDWSLDDTGDRRFWPIQCSHITLDIIAKSRDQWFAEACTTLQTGASWWDMPASTTQVQADRLPDHAWTPLILDGLAFQTETTMADVLMRILSIDKADITRSAELTAGSILRRAGWHSKAVWRHGTAQRRWLAPS